MPYRCAGTCTRTRLRRDRPRLAPVHRASSGLFVRQPGDTDGPGTIDSGVTDDGQFLYLQSGLTGIIDTFHVETDDALNPSRVDDRA